MLRSRSARFLSSASLPLPPRALTTIIKKAPTVRAVLKAYDGAADDANEVHVTSVWARLGELVMRGGGARAELQLGLGRLAHRGARGGRRVGAWLGLGLG